MQPDESDRHIAECISFGIKAVMASSSQAGQTLSREPLSSTSSKDAASSLDSTHDTGASYSQRSVSFHIDKLNASCTVHEWYPTQFHQLRTVCGISLQDFVTSLCAQPLLGGQHGTGKSPSVFFRSQDNRFVLKSMKSSERDFFQNRFRCPYFKHMLRHLDTGGDETRPPQTLLCRFLGMFEIGVCMEHLKLGNRKWTLLVMNNTFTAPALSTVVLPIHQEFDLKGSLHGRRTSTDPAQMKYAEMPWTFAGKAAESGDKSDDDDSGPPPPPLVPVLKDLNLLAGVNTRLFLQPEQLALVNTIIARDCQFLQQNDIMDYSLHVGKHRRAPTQTGKVGIAEGRDIYFLSIIDILQVYNTYKLGETILKRVSLPVSTKVKNMGKRVRGLLSPKRRESDAAAASAAAQNSREISSVNPEQYKIRFCEFMQKELFFKATKSQPGENASSGVVSSFTNYFRSTSSAPSSTERSGIIISLLPSSPKLDSYFSEPSKAGWGCIVS